MTKRKNIIKKTIKITFDTASVNKKPLNQLLKMSHDIGVFSISWLIKNKKKSH